MIDGKRFDELYEVFSEDAHVDYSVFGGSVRERDHTIAFLKKAMPMFPNTQHSNANAQIVVDGDRATGRVMCFNPGNVQTGAMDILRLIRDLPGSIDFLRDHAA